MENLSYYSNNPAIVASMVERELRRARINVVRDFEERQIPDTYLPVAGALGSFIFRRTTVQWVVSGVMPLYTARMLYGDPVGREDIWVAGRSDCPPPAPPLVEWKTQSGKKIISALEMERKRVLVSHGQLTASVLDEFVVSDTPEVDGALGFISYYHIISEVGLRVFADVIRKHGLA